MVHLVSALLFAGAALALPASEIFERQGTCALQSTYAAVSNSKLPNPFAFASGTAVTTKADFDCRAQEISKQLQQFELGDYPPPPDSVKGTLSGNTLTVAVTVGSKSVSFSASIKKPSGTGPFPAIIGIGGASIPIPGTVATITFNNDDFASQASGSSRGQGKFFTLFGNSHSAGALTAWAWGVDRLVDALEQVNATSGIDTTRLGVTGCSRNGKGAFIVGAFVKRIALTIPQESGSGGAACWRISDQQHNAGKNIQTAGEITGENVWFSTRFNSYNTKTNTLPADHHELAAMVVPRGLFVIENDIDWLGPVATTGCMKAGRLIYKGYGVPTNMGFSLVGGHSHCQFPSSQQADLTSYINYFLLKSGSAPGEVEKSSATVDMSSWVDWTVPTLT
ncbi:putative carbohydrate esterase family 15 protein [Phaeoacremonium minimum UCRPA7]|uniref:(4-O-methyl)-D-glucuronate--lignin esterase n=1 Tax=Phaeoacremonium minimum (strain UCR-PA7) TaxID=1286976 RepID=R8BSN9_PHAM7|nr:putative carbohydrate esterase family 15 protein [Phaeoacremonium minimum UCRPA7]EOO02382.1 putative carbohydrate esterase family 15 protein [Phaeoacremonium minimum UCRPA7]